MNVNWEAGFAVGVRLEGGAAVLSANRAGLLSLAGILTALAEGQAGDHIHLDEYNSLDDGSAELIIERIE